MNPQDLASTLFAISFLARHTNANHRVRLQLAAVVRPFDIHSPKEAIEELTSAFLRTRLGRGLKQPPRVAAFNQAAQQATEWMTNGIFLIYRKDLRSPYPELHGLPPFLFARGDPTILEKSAVSILSSRRSRRITPHDPWILAVKELVESATKNGLTTVSSYGAPAHFLVSVLSKGFPTVIVCPGELPFLGEISHQERFIADYGDLFDFSHTLFLSSFPPGTQPPKPQLLLERDHVVAALASELHAVEVRSGGNMEAVLAIAARRKARIVLHDTAESRKDIVQNRVVKTRVLKPTAASGHSAVAQHPLHRSKPRGVGQSGFLYHYTRSCPGPWPGQTVGEYWKSLVNGNPDAGHTALDTLARILLEGVIRASNKLTRGDTRVVCFSECEPSLLGNIMKWRPGLIRWSLEPYAIGIRRESLLELGALQVIYGERSDYKNLDGAFKHLFQINKTSGMDWAVEKEWRVIGDIELDALSRGDVMVIVATDQEAESMMPNVRFRVESAGFEADSPFDK